jgi:hypothetical protein
VYARQLAQRSAELDRAVRASKPPRVVQALAVRVAWLSQQIADDALALRAAGKPQPAVRAQAALGAMRRYLDRLQGQASPEVRAVLRRLWTALAQQEQRLAAGKGAGEPATAP